MAASRLTTNYTLTFQFPNTSNATILITYAADAYPRETFRADAVRFHYDPLDVNGEYTLSEDAQITVLRADRCTSPAHTGVANLVSQMQAIASLSGVGANVVVTNFPAVQTVAVNNFPATQPVSGTVIAEQGSPPWLVTLDIASTGTIPFDIPEPNSTDILGSSRTTTGTLITVPTGRVFCGSTSLSCSTAAAGANNPTISVSGADAVPTGTIHQIMNTGLATMPACNANTQNNVFIYGGSAGATVTFTVGATGTSSGSIIGRIMPEP